MRVLLVLLSVLSVWSQDAPCTTLPDWVANIGDRHYLPGTCANLVGSATPGTTVNFQSGFTCHIECAQGYILDGSGDVSCTNGAWNSLTAVCVLRTTIAPATTTSAPNVDPTTTTHVDPTTTTHVDPTTTTSTPHVDPTTTTAPNVTDPATTTTAPNVTATPSPTAGVGQQCTGDSNLGGVVIKCASGLSCFNHICFQVSLVGGDCNANVSSVIASGSVLCVYPLVCVDHTCKNTSAPSTTAVPATTTKAPETTTTTAATTTTAPVTTTAAPVIKVGLGDNCTGDVPAGVLKIVCSAGLRCSPDHICVLNTTVVTTAAPTTQAPQLPGGLGDKCGGDLTRLCGYGLVCIALHPDVSTSGTCQVPNVTAAPPTTGQPGGPCGGTTRIICPDGYECALLPTVAATTNVTGQTVDTVGGYCKQKNSTIPPPTCQPGQQPVVNSTTGAVRCAPCPFGTHSEHGLLCVKCPLGRRTPVPDPLVLGDIGPIFCEACPQTFVADPSCFPTPQCFNCDLSSKVCNYLALRDPTLSVIPLPVCKPKVCTQACINGFICFNGECKQVAIVNTDPATATTIATQLAVAGVDPTTTTTVLTTVPTSGNLDGTTTVVTSNAALDTATLDGNLVVNSAALVTNTANIPRDGTTVVGPSAQLQVGTLNVVANVDGTPTTATISTQPDGTGSSSVKIQQLNAGGNSVRVLGDGDVHIGNTTGSDGATVVVSGPKLSGVITTPVVISGDVKASIDVNDRLTITAAISGGPDATVNVNKGGDFRAPNATVTANLRVDGNVTVGNTTFKGTVDVTGRVLINTTKDQGAPHFELFKSCDSTGVIYYRVDQPCKALGGSQGTLFTSASLTVANFNCKLVIVATDCEITLTVKKADPLTHARRLLGATTSTSSNCNTADVSQTGANYALCDSRSSASGTTLSYITLFATLFVTLCLRM